MNPRRRLIWDLAQSGGHFQARDAPATNQNLTNLGKSQSPIARLKQPMTLRHLPFPSLQWRLQPRGQCGCLRSSKRRYVLGRQKAANCIQPANPLARVLQVDALVAENVQLRLQAHSLQAPDDDLLGAKTLFEKLRSATTVKPTLFSRSSSRYHPFLGLQGHSDGVLDLSLCSWGSADPASSFVASCGVDSRVSDPLGAWESVFSCRVNGVVMVQVILWDLHHRSPVLTYSSSSTPCAFNSVRAHPTRPWLCVAAGDGTVHLLQLDKAANSTRLHDEEEKQTVATAHAAQSTEMGAHSASTSPNSAGPPPEQSPRAARSNSWPSGSQDSKLSEVASAGDTTHSDTSSWAIVSCVKFCALCVVTIEPLLQSYAVMGGLPVTAADWVTLGNNKHMAVGSWDGSVRLLQVQESQLVQVNLPVGVPLSQCHG